MDQDYNNRGSGGKRTLPNVIKSLKKLSKKGTTSKMYCQNPGCNNVISEDGVIYNYCSDSCQLANTNPFEDSGYDLEDTWSSGDYQNKKAPKSNNVYTSYSSNSFKNDNSYNSASSYIRNQDSSSEWNSQEESSEDYPAWYNSSLDMEWKPQKTNNSNNNAYPSRGQNSDQEIECPTCTYFVRSNRTTCEMCGTIVKKENNRVGINGTEHKNNRFSYKDDDDLYVSSPKSKDNACPKCTYLLEPGSSTCGMCGNVIRKENSTIRRESNRVKRNDYLDDDLYVSSPKPKNDACPRCTYLVRPGSTKCEMCGTDIKENNRNRIEYDDDDLYIGPASKKNNENRNRIEYDDDDDDLYVGPVRKENENKSRIEYDDDDDLYVGPVRKENKNKSRIEYDDDDDDLYTRPVRKEDNNNRSIFEYDDDDDDDDDDLYVGPPRSNALSSTKRQQLPTPPPQTTDTEQIPCPECLYMNHPLMVNCERCQEVLNHNSVDNDLLLLQLEAEQYDFKVICPNCSFLNAGFAAQCEMCFLPISDGSSSKENTEMVQCSKCTFMNNIAGITCEVCNEDLPGAAEQRRAYEEFYNNTHTRMTPMNATDPDYIAVQRRFLLGLPTARIQAIIRMNMPRRLVDAHENYKAQTRHQTHEMFHGTSVACKPERYYDNSPMTFCTAYCGLCGISQHGNLRSVSRHGGRMWFARSSAVSLGYCTSAPTKAMFSVDIINPAAQDIIIVDKEAATLIKFLILYQV